MIKENFRINLLKSKDTNLIDIPKIGGTIIFFQEKLKCSVKFLLLGPAFFRVIVQFYIHGNLPSSWTGSSAGKVKTLKMQGRDHGFSPGLNI